MYLYYTMLNIWYSVIVLQANESAFLLLGVERSDSKHLYFYVALFNHFLRLVSPVLSTAVLTSPFSRTQRYLTNSFATVADEAEMATNSRRDVSSSKAYSKKVSLCDSKTHNARTPNRRSREHRFIPTMLPVPKIGAEVEERTCCLKESCSISKVMYGYPAPAAWTAAITRPRQGYDKAWCVVSSSLWEGRETYWTGT